MSVLSLPPDPQRPSSTRRSRRRPSVCIVGAGPRGLSVLERICANAVDAPGLDEPGVGQRRGGAAEGDVALEVHVVDPFPPGAGRIWREDQPGLLWMNSQAGDVAMYPDPSVQMEGVLHRGPTLWGWLQESRGQLSGQLDAEAARADARWFASRPLQGRYLGAIADAVIDAAREAVAVQVHADSVTDVTDASGGRQLVQLSSGRTLEVDVVVLALGHLDVELTADERALESFARSRGLVYIGPGYAADLSLDTLPEGEPVIVSGLGLGFVDDLVLLTQGRGGSFAREDGVLVYRPSGREPVMYVGSRRGVPYHSKISYGWTGTAPQGPQWFTPDVVAALQTLDGTLDFHRDLWPLAAKELTGAYYRRLFTEHGDRTAFGWEAFLARFESLQIDDPALDDLVARAVPDPRDRLDLARLERPAAGLTFADAEAAHQWVVGHVDADLARRRDPGHSADLALFHAFVIVYGILATVVVFDPRTASRVSARSRVALEGWWHSFFSFYASGPPQARTEEILALARAGVLRFIGPDVSVVADPELGVFRASSPAVPGRVQARALLEARLPAPSVSRARDPLVRALHARGEYREQVFEDPVDGALRSGRVDVDPSGRLLHDDGCAHPARFAVGPWVAGGAFSSAFARSGVNAGFFRQNDAVSLSVLAAVRELDRQKEAVA